MNRVHFRFLLRLCRSVGPVVLVFAMAIALTLLGLGNNAFWDDEANTALFARNFIESGHLSAWDGTNLIGFRRGAELNSQLVNVYMPPVQYYVAAIGLKLFGLTTVGGRIPFVVLGLLSILTLALAVRWHFRGRVVEWLPVLLVAANPAYLMFIRQCRYYAVVSLLTLVLVAGWFHPKRSARSLLFGSLVGCAAALLLMFTNYMNAVAIGIALPLLLLVQRHRRHQNVVYLAAIYCGLVGAGLYVLLTANPLGLHVSYRSTITGAHRVAMLFWWHITGLAHFEFFPTITFPLLLVFWAFKRGRLGDGTVRDGMLLCAMLVVYSAVIVAFSPQTIDGNTRVADMRYVVPLIPIGAMATGVVLVQLWRVRWMGRVASITVLVLLLMSNVFTSAYAHRQPLRSTLLQYVQENVRDYTTGNEVLIQHLASLPRGQVIRVVPDYMTYPAMFYVPKHHYCCQLGEDHVLNADLKARLPDYVYFGRILPDYLLVGGNITPAQLLYQSVLAYGPGKYRLGPILGQSYRDCSRPEIPWHCFGPPEGTTQGFLVLELLKPTNRRSD